jgi:hypothetical protein
MTIRNGQTSTLHVPAGTRLVSCPDGYPMVIANSQIAAGSIKIYTNIAGTYSFSGPRSTSPISIVVPQLLNTAAEKAHRAAQASLELSRRGAG